MATLTPGPNSGLGHRVRGGRSRQVMHFPETATQTFAIDDLVTFDTTALKQNKIKLASTASPCTTTPIVGRVQEAASTVEGTLIAVCPADEETEWLGHVDNGVALLASMVNSDFGVVWDGTVKCWRVNTADTTNKRVRVTELFDSVGDINGRVWVKWLNADRAPIRS
jgi:hypothetical protein